MWYRIRGFLSQSVIAITLVSSIFIGLNSFMTHPAWASIRRMEEAPGQVLQNILSQLPVTKLNLSMAMKGSRSIALSIPSKVVLERQSVAVKS